MNMHLSYSYDQDKIYIFLPNTCPFFAHSKWDLLTLVSPAMLPLLPSPTQIFYSCYHWRTNIAVEEWDDFPWVVLGFLSERQMSFLCYTCATLLLWNSLYRYNSIQKAKTKDVLSLHVYLWWLIHEKEKNKYEFQILRLCRSCEQNIFLMCMLNRF